MTRLRVKNGRPRDSAATKKLRGTYRRDRAARPLHIELGWPSKAALRAAWTSPTGQRDLREWARYLPGTRPLSWWYTIAPVRRRPSESQRDYLARLKLLLPGEAKRLSNG